MPLPTPQLDDRRFQDIVDQAKRMIPHYCPEWTDHNVSDPGVTLIELFAWMTEMLLFRVNQVPDKVYITFLEMIGIHLEAPRAARVPVTFYLSAPQPADVTIPAETEVATVRTETSPAIIFTTETDLIIRPPVVTGAFTRAAGQGGAAGWTIHDLRQLELPGRRVPLFPPAQPAPGDAFYLALEKDHSHHVLALVLECETAGGAGVDPTNPPLEWQAWQGGLARWVNCELEYDSTGGFNQSGEIILHLPAMVEDELQGTRAYWLRCRLTEEQANARNAYRVSPDLERLTVEARGGTASARHAVTITNEPVGHSDGTPGQTFKLLYTPILARDPARDYLIVVPPGESEQHWQEVTDFAASGPEDHHFTLDSLDGTLKLGPALIQPDGTMYRFGTVPPHGATLQFSRYQYGGGISGNVPRGTLAVLKTSIPYVARVTNRAPAVGGRNEQSLEDAKLRAAQILRSRTRAVTADDYEYLAAQVPNVARAYCLAPGVQPAGPADLQPGQVLVLVLPESHTATGRLTPDQLVLSAEVRSAVMAHLAERSVIGTRLEVREPRYIWVSVFAQLRRPEGSDPQQNEAIEQQVEAALYRYLNPYTGGPGGKGWPLGRDLHISELYGLLQQIPAIDFVEEVRFSIGDPGSGVPTPHNAPRLTVPRDTIICSGQHRVQIS